MRGREIERGFCREFVERGRARMGDADWSEWVMRYRGRPNDFALKVLGSRWWSAQEEVGRALTTSRRVAVRSGNGVGKTYLAADLALWFLYTHRPVAVITTAPTLRQVEGVLWREIRRRVKGVKKRLPGRLLTKRLELADESFAMGVSAEGGVEFQGVHCENLLIIFDEASGIPEDIWDAAEGMAVSANNRILAIGNPLQCSGRFYQAFARAKGWKRVTISALQHPNVTGRGRPIPGCVTAGHLEEKLEEWCEEAEGTGFRVQGTGSDETTDDRPPTADGFVWHGRVYVPNDLFRARVLGEFPKEEEYALIPLRWIEAAAARSLPVEGCKRAAVDVARFGGDSTVIGMRVGSVLTFMDVIRGADTGAVTGAIKRVAYGEHPASIAVDGIGLGAGIVDRLREDEIDGVVEVNVAQAAFDSEHFANRRAELYWGLRERFRKGDIQIKDDPQLVEELASIRYRLNAKGQTQIEEKHKMKQRLRRSPDRADMLAMLFDSSCDWVTGGAQVYVPPSPAAILRREMEVW